MESALPAAAVGARELEAPVEGALEEPQALSATAAASVASRGGARRLTPSLRAAPRVMRRRPAGRYFVAAFFVALFFLLALFFLPFFACCFFCGSGAGLKRLYFE